MTGRTLRYGTSSTLMLGLLLTAGAVGAEIRKPTFTIDIAGDCNRFITEGKGHLDPALNPVFGDNFVQEGIIYEGGTFEANCPETLDCGLLEDGTPEFPDKVIGKWTCYGAFIGNGIATTEGAWIASTQVYEFGVEEVAENVFTPGEHGLTSHGTERADFEPWRRAVTGGFGRFKTVRGEIEQVKVGFNQTTCENFTFSFAITPHRKP